MHYISKNRPIYAYSQWYQVKYIGFRNIQSKKVIVDHLHRHCAGVQPGVLDHRHSGVPPATRRLSQHAEKGLEAVN